jgi:hypothetical protein
MPYFSKHFSFVTSSYPLLNQNPQNFQGEEHRDVLNAPYLTTTALAQCNQIIIISRIRIVLKLCDFVTMVMKFGHSPWWEDKNSTKKSYLMAGIRGSLYYLKPMNI